MKRFVEEGGNGMKFRGVILLACAIFAGSAAKAADFAVTIVLEKNIDVPATVAWKKIGGFCQIDQWMSVTCSYKSGKGEPGTIRAISSKAGGGEEVEVGMEDALVLRLHCRYTVHSFLPCHAERRTNWRQNIEDRLHLFLGPGSACRLSNSRKTTIC